MERRILSVQSHVVHGYCGNRAATFPLQLLGWEVDALNTVQFSNHTGYPKFKGFKTSNEQLIDIFNGLEINGLLEYSHLLTGYAPGAESVRALIQIVDKLKQKNPDLIYSGYYFRRNHWLRPVLDPVMGDNGQLYVSEEVPELYKTLLQQATVTTPNQFEVEVLTGVKITDKSSLRACLDKFHSLYKVPHVIISSLSLGEKGRLYCAGSSRSGEAFLISFPELDGEFVGTGDAFSALISAHYSSSVSLSASVRKALTSLAGILEKTAKRQHEQHQGPPIEDAAYFMRKAELRIIQSQKDILEPTEERAGQLWISPAESIRGE